MIKLNIKSKEHFYLYLFGSALYSEAPTDMDIAIIYDKSFVTIQEAIQYRHELLKLLSEVTTLKIDTILLSKEEERESEFLSNAKHQIL